MVKDHLEQALKIIDSGDATRRCFAALELRLAIEKHVYEKLAHFAKPPQRKAAIRKMAAE